MINLYVYIYVYFFSIKSTENVLCCDTLLLLGNEMIYIGIWHFSSFKASLLLNLSSLKQLYFLWEEARSQLNTILIEFSRGVNLSFMFLSK